MTTEVDPVDDVDPADEDTDLLAEVKRRLMGKGPARFGKVETIATTAHLVTLAIRDIAPQDLYTVLVTVAGKRPERLVQVMMALAAWVDPDEPITVRHNRVYRITTSRVA
ncbi:hypothetical protein [Nocardia transvalensis]|uniref:hypothetical protein n=1 Tax=Nocardia transvalensis TaxID=37333 RepID=UPI0018952662|nr:hypothetical protein [Nocardia transvalensis]MBF6332446.1 hypothetical protein [Nocardia transvalensis]